MENKLKFCTACHTVNPSDANKCRECRSNLTLYNYALSDKTTSTLLKIPRRFKNSNKSNYEEFYKLGCATIHQKNNLLFRLATG